jgi:hypothetical protein
VENEYETYNRVLHIAEIGGIEVLVWCLEILCTCEQKPTTSDNLLQKGQKKEKQRTTSAQNSTFATRTNRHTTEVCKRAVFLLTH